MNEDVPARAFSGFLGKFTISVTRIVDAERQMKLAVGVAAVDAEGAFGRAAVALLRGKSATMVPLFADGESPAVPIAATLLIVTFFVTSADSGALVIDTITNGAAEAPPVWQRVFWAVLEGSGRFWRF